MISMMKVLLFFYLFASIEIQARILLEHSAESRTKSFYGRPSLSPPPSPTSAPPSREISTVVFPTAEKGLANFLSMVTSSYEQTLTAFSLPCAIESSCKKVKLDVSNYGRTTPSPPPSPHRAPPTHQVSGSKGLAASAQSPPNPFLAST